MKARLWVVRGMHANSGMRGTPKTWRPRLCTVRGFSLVEMMVVVAIMGILATLGLSLTRKYIHSSHSAEALSTISAIRAAQEEWRTHTQGYFRVSASATTWYPTDTPDDTRRSWHQTAGADFPNWELLGPHVEWPVRFGYATVAGPAGTAIDALGTIVSAPGWGTPDQPWYVIQAKADLDKDGTPAYFVASSMSSEIYSENVGE